MSIINAQDAGRPKMKFSDLIVLGAVLLICSNARAQSVAPNTENMAPDAGSGSALNNQKVTEADKPADQKATAIGQPSSAQMEQSKPQTLGEIAREYREKRAGRAVVAKVAPGKPKDQSWMESALAYQAHQANNTSEERVPVDIAQLPILELSCGALGRAILVSVDPKLDVLFPGRSSWEQDVCRNRDQWKFNTTDTDPTKAPPRK
jgi:hypothetical protein